MGPPQLVVIRLCVVCTIFGSRRRKSFSARVCISPQKVEFVIFPGVGGGTPTLLPPVRSLHSFHHRGSLHIHIPPAHTHTACTYLIPTACTYPPQYCGSLSRGNRLASCTREPSGGLSLPLSPGSSTVPLRFLYGSLPSPSLLCRSNTKR